jgi:hypothetical protein
VIKKVKELIKILFFIICIINCNYNLITKKRAPKGPFNLDILRLSA